MRDLFFVKKLYLAMFLSQKPESKNDKEWDFERQQVCDFIRQWLEDNFLNHIINETKANVL